MKTRSIPKISRMIESDLRVATKRPVQVSFGHLGKVKTYSIAIQTTLYEFEGTDIGPKGTMYLTLNTTLLQDKKTLTEVVNRIAEKYKSE